MVLFKNFKLLVLVEFMVANNILTIRFGFNSFLIFRLYIRYIAIIVACLGSVFLQGIIKVVFKGSQQERGSINDCSIEG